MVLNIIATVLVSLWTLTTLGKAVWEHARGEWTGVRSTVVASAVFLALVGVILWGIWA